MSTIIKLLVSLVGLQMVATLCLAASEQRHEMSSASLLATFRQLTGTLVEKVHSGDLNGNLKAARELIAKETKTGCLSCFLNQEKDIVNVADGFVHLLEVASQSDVECTQESLDYLDDYSRAHSFEILAAEEREIRRLHPKLLGRVDELIEARLESILAKCEQYYDDTYHQLLAKLSPEIKQQVYELFPDSVLPKKSKVKVDQQMVVTTLAKEIDLNNYKAALQSNDFERFQSYYINFYKQHLRKPCKVFEEHFETFVNNIAKTNNLCIRYNIPFKHSFRNDLHRFHQCSLFGEFSDDPSFGGQAADIYNDYLSDARLADVQWGSRVDRWSGRPRLY